MRSKWCRPDALITGADIRWYAVWRRQCSERWSPVLYDIVEWYGMVDGAVVYYFWHCPEGELPRLYCVELDAREGLERLLRVYERDKPAKVHCRGELPRELLLTVCGGGGP